MKSKSTKGNAAGKKVVKAAPSKGLLVPQNTVSHYRQKAFIQVAVKQYRNR
jgi:hypothetical protein